MTAGAKQTNAWKREWGTVEKNLAALEAESPVQNAQTLTLTRALIFVGENDTRLSPAHSWEYQAALKQKAQG